MNKSNAELVLNRGNNVIDLFLVDVNDKVVTFPFFEPVCAGFPSPAADYEQSPLDPRDYLIKNQASTFFARVDAGIFENDVIVV